MNDVSTVCNESITLLYIRTLLVEVIYLDIANDILDIELQIVLFLTQFFVFTNVPVYVEVYPRGAFA